MAPKSKITKEMILKAGMEIVRRQGAEALNVRSAAAVLGCSTQPVMYHFSTMEELKQEIYVMVDAYHSEFIMQFDPAQGNPMLSIGQNYIRFAVEERNLFRFLFQSEQFGNQRMQDLTDAEGLSPIFEILQMEAGLTAKQSRNAFAALFYAVHGMASLLANNAMKYEESYCAGILEQVFFGVIGSMKGGNL